LVSIGTLGVIGALGLLIFFRKDIGEALGNLKGFGSEFGRDFGKIPDVTINVPDFGLPKVFADTGEAVGQAGAGIAGALGEAGENINQFGIDVQKNIADSIAGAQAGIDQSIKDTQEGFEQFGKDVQTNIGIISTGFEEAGQGITDFFGGLFPTKEITTVSEAVPTITSRRAGTTTRFGGQTAPKEILTQETATTPKLIISEQPDLSLVSPFLTQFQKDPIDEPTLITSRRTGTTGGR